MSSQASVPRAEGGPGAGRFSNRGANLAARRDERRRARRAPEESGPAPSRPPGASHRRTRRPRAGALGGALVTHRPGRRVTSTRPGWSLAAGREPRRRPRWRSASLLLSLASRSGASPGWGGPSAGTRPVFTRGRRARCPSARAAGSWARSSSSSAREAPHGRSGSQRSSWPDPAPRSRWGCSSTFGIRPGIPPRCSR